MKNIMRLLTSLLFMALISGCAGVVFSQKPVGLEPYRLEPDGIDGIWISDDVAILLKTMDSAKGVLKMVILEDPQDTFSLNAGPMEITLMRGEKWLYFNIPPGKGELAGEGFRWGRILLRDRNLVYWLPSASGIIKAIREKKLAGLVKTETEDGRERKIKSILITDTPLNLVRLIENSETPFFEWDDPVFFLKLSK